MGMRALLEALLHGGDPGVKDRLRQKMSRKEPEPKHLPFIHASGLAPDERAFIDRLPRFAQEELWDVRNPRLTTTFASRGPVPQWFVGDLDDDITVLVDTEGYDYCRYSGRLMGLDH